MGKIYKQALYDFLELKEKQAIKKNIDPLLEEIENKKNELYNEFLKTNNLDFNEIQKNSSNIKNVLFNLVDSISYRPYRIDTYLNSLDSMSKNDFKSYILDSIESKELELMRNKVDTLRNDIKVEYAKLNAIIKKKPNGIKGYEYLKEIGFDVADVKIIDEYQLEIGKVDKNLLGL